MSIHHCNLETTSQNHIPKTNINKPGGGYGALGGATNVRATAEKKRR